VKKKLILSCLFCVFIFTVNCQEFPYEPWGPWTTYPLYEDVAVIRNYKSEKFYQNGHGGIWILEDYDYKDDSFTAFAENGGFTKIEKYDPTDYGYLFYLVGNGIRHKINEKTEFKDEMRVQVKMIFIDRDTCRFEFISLYDEEGYKFAYIIVNEKSIYHRYRVEDE
jgi:hypothetical protein